MTVNFENVNHLVLNFYPDGYSIAVKLNEFPVFTSETILETAKISYEETSLLDYIENEELPPLLVEMIDGSPKLSQYKIWYNGCLILEVRDKINVDSNRGTSHTSKVQDSQGSSAKKHPVQNYSTFQIDSQWLPKQSINGYRDHEASESSESTTSTNEGNFILLKPTNLSMLNDVLNLTESNLWSTEDRLQLESQIVLHNSPPLFLEPDATKQAPDHASQWPETNSNPFYTRNRKKLPYTKLLNVYATTAGVKQSKSTLKTSIYQTAPESLPSELTLQQFLATRRTKKKTFAAGHLAKFHRFKKHDNVV